MTAHDKVNILLVDDQPAKLLSYEVVLRELNENLIKATSGKEALHQLLKNDVAVVLIDVIMPDLDGFQLASMIREHPRFERTAIIFVSAVSLTDVDRLKGYEMGAVDYLPVPIIPEVLQAKVRVFAELFRKTRDLELLNRDLEARVEERTAELESSAAQLRESEQRRSLALAAGHMGSWDWDISSTTCSWDKGQHHIFGVDENSFKVTPANVRPLIHSDDWERLERAIIQTTKSGQSSHIEFRVLRPNGEVRWCIGAAAGSVDENKRIVRLSGVCIDITDRREAEERQSLLAREVDHRARNALALAQSIVRLTKASTRQDYVASVEGRISALARAHTLLSQSRWQGADLGRLVFEELAPFQTSHSGRISVQGPDVSLDPREAQTLALALHELVTNAAKYGALSAPNGRLSLTWEYGTDGLRIEWVEISAATVERPSSEGFGTKLIVASIEKQLGGQVSMDWRPEGLRCSLALPPQDPERLDRHMTQRSNQHEEAV